MENGKVKFWNPEKGTGRIEHPSDVKGISFKKENFITGGINKGVKVEFDIEQDQSGKKKAINISVQGRKHINSSSHNPAKKSNRSELPNPYHFIKLNTSNALSDTPVWHDGKNSTELLSGKMQISLKALTPLLVGQWQYKKQDVSNQHFLVDLPDIDKEKSILEPLRLADGRVVLSGTSLKGMIRHSLSGLLSAPMERVAERSYSYRPNAKFQNDESFRKVRPAVIEFADDAQVKVRILPHAKSAWFGDIHDLNQPIYDQVARDWEEVSKEKPNHKGMQKNRFKKQSGESLGECYFSYYDGGTDGTGTLSKTFNARGGTYSAVLIPKEDYDKGKAAQNIPVDVIKHYLATLTHLQDEQGLLASGYPNGTRQEHEKARKAIAQIEARWLTNRASLIGRLIYIELENDDVITSMGHHYYYRWRYADTIRTLWQSPDESSIRSILAPLATETIKNQQGQPEQLSVARLLFGYASRTEIDPLKQDGTANIGEKQFQRLAGRLHINSALEVLAKGSDALTKKRFLDEGKTLALQPLGQPRPSAVEHYLLQTKDQATLQNKRGDGGQMFSYGDLAQKNQIPLAGRKFYLHQPDASTDQSLYLAQDDEHKNGKQAMLVRFVSKPSTEFRFTVGFKDLRAWELGALLVTLMPERYLVDLLVALKQKKPEFCVELEVLVNKITHYQGNSPLFAHKLGHARSLGFGSVQLDADALLLLKNKESRLDLQAIEKNEEQQAINAFSDQLAAQLKSIEPLQQWCALHQYAGRTRSTYPVKVNNRDNKPCIFEYHSQARSEHIAARRLERGQGKLSIARLKPLGFDPKGE